VTSDELDVEVSNSEEGLILAAVGAEAMTRVLQEMPVQLEAWNPVVYVVNSAELTCSAMIGVLRLA
jgi:hypothetical protein